MRRTVSRSLRAAAAASLSGGGAAARVRVATYNALSPRLCSAGYFRRCAPEACDRNGRLPRVLAQLGSVVDDDPQAVVCLQELALEWCGPLHAFFAARGYTFMASNYGNAFNGYMGVGLAFPSRAFDLVDADLCRLAETRDPPWPKPPPPGPIRKVKGFLGGAVGWALAPLRAALKVVPGLGALGGRRRDDQCPWEYSQRRFNSLAFARLRCKSTGAVVCVATYHMPCAFWWPGVMLIHSAMAVQRVQRLARGDPCVLAGDFNIRPEGSMYRLITTGSLPADHPDIPAPRAWDPWVPTVKAPMKSAYAVANGREPDFTNYAAVKDDPPFIDCIDYIFVSEDVGVEAVKLLPHRSEVDGPYPTIAEPSDHVLIHATLKVLDYTVYVPSGTEKVNVYCPPDNDQHPVRIGSKSGPSLMLDVPKETLPIKRTDTTYTLTFVIEDLQAQRRRSSRRRSSYKAKDTPSGTLLAITADAHTPLDAESSIEDGFRAKPAMLVHAFKANVFSYTLHVPEETERIAFYCRTKDGAGVKVGADHSSFSTLEFPCDPVVVRNAGNRYVIACTTSPPPNLLQRCGLTCGLGDEDGGGCVVS